MMPDPAPHSTPCRYYWRAGDCSDPPVGFHQTVRTGTGKPRGCACMSSDLKVKDNNLYNYHSLYPRHIQGVLMAHQLRNPVPFHLTYIFTGTAPCWYSGWRLLPWWYSGWRLLSSFLFYKKRSECNVTSWVYFVPVHNDHTLSSW